MGKSCKTLGDDKKYTIIVRKFDRGEQWREIVLHAWIILEKFLKTQVAIL